MVKGKAMTAHKAIKTDMKNAGADYQDYGVLVDGNIITAQGEEDVPSFLKKIVAVLKVASN
jgi:protease I